MVKQQHPGSERERDEQRAGGPRYHGAQWQSVEAEPVDGAEADVIEPEAVSSGEHEGMGRVRGHGHSDETREPPPGDFSRAMHDDPTARQQPERPTAASARARGTSAAELRGRKTPERR